jgi:hypothetical protein
VGRDVIGHTGVVHRHKEATVEGYPTLVEMIRSLAAEATG